MSLNTVMQCDIRLLQMELDWKLNRSGPFPEGVQNVIVDLRAALVIREAEASQKIPASAYAATPITSTTTTTTMDLNTTASTETTTVAMAATIKLHKMTQDNSKEHKGSEEIRGEEIGDKNKETRTEECEKSARTEIPETRRDEGGEGEQIACKVRVKEGENEKSEAASEGIKEG